jgi:ubiquinone/menaquinone biosynthesis C-methylase UbiE
MTPSTRSSGLALRGGESVLDLGCGTGAVTARLLARGAHVTALDQSSSMLARARARAPRAKYIQGDLASLSTLEGSFDAITCSFVLHEIARDARLVLLRAARERLRAGGRLGVLDWSLPRSGLARRSWHLVIAAVEGRWSIVTTSQLKNDLELTGFEVTKEEACAGGRAGLLVATKK